ncbi:hypothetical protein MCAMS1_02847 [biofilm metagenome]
MARKKFNSDIPAFDELFIPTVKALEELGGSGSVEEINNKVYLIAKLTDDILQVPHGQEGTMSEVDYRLTWTRNYLKNYNLLENSSRGIWALKSNININDLDPNIIVKAVREKNRIKSTTNETINKEAIEQDVLKEIENAVSWKDQLLNVLYSLSPAAFERLAQRILRESGFFHVEVTGKSGDGGIDGKGIIRVGGLLSFHVIFQCKRYKGSVTPNQIRDFRGAMQGRADKGLFITTGTFTRESIKEATRDGAPPIDLIDGDMLCDKLKELKLGVNVKLSELVEIKSEWFINL